MPEVVIASRGCVGPGDVLALNLSRDGDVLSWWEAKGVLRVRQAEAVERGVVRDGDLLGQREFTPFFGAEHRLTTCT